MIMPQVLYTGTRATLGRNFSHSLKSVVQRELKVDMDKEEQTSDWDALVLTPEQKRYAAFDAAVLPKLAAKLLRRKATATTSTGHPGRSNTPSRR
jgi:ribonuclease D